MHLITVTVRNYRLHRELTVNFDRARTLIGGPNEAGKSTLIEAIHRGLFFPAKSGAGPQQRMRSTRHTGHPEVEITFEASGRSFRLLKRFSGQSGTTTLAEAGGVPLQGSEAEERLAQVLGVSPDASAKVATERWAHLWVWQGISGDNPESHLTGQRDALLARLQAFGGAAAMQSALDAGVADQFAQWIERNLTQTGRPKAGSELEKVQVELQAADAALMESTARVARLEAAVTDVHEAAQAIATAEADLASLSDELAAANVKRERVAALQQQLEKEERLAAEAAKRYSDLCKTHERVLRLETGLAEMLLAIDPLSRELAVRAKSRLERSRDVEAAEKAAREAGDTLREANLRRELAAAHLLLFEKRAEYSETSLRWEQGCVVEAELIAERAKLAQLPELTSERVRALQELERDAQTARAALNAMAAGVELIESTVDVTAGDRALAVGEARIVTEDTEVTIGASTRLRIRPGGGQSLSGAREAERVAVARLREALDEHGLTSVAAAVEVGARRDALTANVKAGQIRLADFKVAALARKRVETGETIAAAEGQISRIAHELPTETPPADITSARAAVAAIEQAMRDITKADRRARAAVESARQVWSEAEKAYEQQRQACELEGSRITQAEIELRLLVEANGGASARAFTCSQARSESDAATQTAAATRGTLHALQPELLPATLSRLDRAIEEKRQVVVEADKKTVVAQTLLRSDGASDPQSELEQCRARQRFAQERHTSVRRRVAAIQLLDDLFREEQRRLADQFTRPLADKISSYLQCLFGVGARAVLSLQDNSFEGLQLVRPSGGNEAVPFDSLSGGTREQVAAAVRLATTELLAGDYDGCLPVVFDDAFAFSDGVRVKSVQEMLDLAATRELQVIVLSCNPSDYSSLGAREVRLSPSLSAAVTEPNGNVVVEAASDSGQPEAFSDERRSNLPLVEDSQRAALLTILRKFGGPKGNQKLREALGWDQVVYDTVKRDLINRGVLVAGRGRGGSVAEKIEGGTRCP